MWSVNKLEQAEMDELLRVVRRSEATVRRVRKVLDDRLSEVSAIYHDDSRLQPKWVRIADVRAALDGGSDG